MQSKEYYRTYYENNKERIINRTKEWRKRTGYKNPTPSKYSKEKAKLLKQKPYYIWDILKRRSSKKSHQFELSRNIFTEWYSRAEKVCHYCGVDEILHKTILGRRLEIDRINNTLPYTIDNITLACRYCNSIKGSFLSEEETKFIGVNVIKNKWTQ